MRLQPRRGSHLPVLMKLVNTTRGSILELGCGVYSTIYLHWACYPSKRRLVTFESNPQYFDFAKQFETDFHTINCIENMDAWDIREPWAIAFVDHAPDTRRIEEIKRLVHADFVVAHDAENRFDRKYRYSTIWPLFKYRWKYSDTMPHTAVFSNKHDLSNFTVT